MQVHSFKLPSHDGERQYLTPVANLLYRVVHNFPPRAKGTALLIPGSGLLDCDGRVNGRPLLRQLSDALVRQGIGTVRFGTRPFSGRPLPRSFADEYDRPVAAIAAALMGGHYGTWNRPLALIGHSLGGHLATGISNRLAAFDGVGILNASTRPLVQLWTWQLARVPHPIAAIARQMADTLTFDYLKASSAVDVCNDVERSVVPVIVIGGGRDSHIPVEDFSAWRRAVVGCNAPSAAYWIPDLSHFCCDVSQDHCPVTLNSDWPISRILISRLDLWMNTLTPRLCDGDVTDDLQTHTYTDLPAGDSAAA